LAFAAQEGIFTVQCKILPFACSDFGPTPLLGTLNEVQPLVSISLNWEDLRGLKQDAASGVAFAAGLAFEELLFRLSQVF
jgi:hypothetical protein